MIAIGICPGVLAAQGRRAPLAEPTEVPVNIAPPVISPSGGLSVGDWISWTRGTFSGRPTSFTAQIYADGAPIDGATSSPYQLTAAEEGAAAIEVGVIASNAIGPSEEALSAPVGPIAPAPDTTAPTIISANPSGPYEEGATIGGTLTADETATFSVTGTDADAVTLDPDTGVWSLEETVFATKASYSFSFTATDAAQNVSAPQVVAITITEAEEVPWTVNTVVIEGDSITSAMPSTYSDAFHSYRYADSRTDLTIAVRAQGSRLIGTAANLDDDSNSLMGNVAEDMAYGPDLITTLIGANDMTSGSAADYKTNLAAWYAAVKAARPVCRVAWSAPIPYNPNGEHPTYANFTAQRAIVMADARDPAVWGQWADYYLPMAEHPDWVEIGSVLYGDTVHPTGFDAVNGTGGQNRLYDQFKAAIDSIADATRASSTAPYGSVWPADEASLAGGVPITRRFVVSGINHTGLASGISVSGGDAQVRLNGAAYGSSIGRIYNGDVIDLKLTTSATAETAVTVSLTIGSETREISYTTAAEATPVEYVHGGIIYVQPGGGTTHTFTTVPLAGLSPLALVTSTEVTAVTLTPSAGGDPISATKQFTESGSNHLSAWLATLPADDYDIAITLAGWSKTSVLSYGSVNNADPVPAQVVHNSPGSDSPPHLTPAMTVPATGVALVFFAEYGGASITPATANSPTVLIDEGHAPAFESETFGLALGSLAESGQGSFTYAYGPYPRGGVVFAAA